MIPIGGQAPGARRAVLVQCSHPEGAVEVDPLAAEAAAVLSEVREALVGGYGLPEESVVSLSAGATPADFVAELAAPGDLFVCALGHGGCCKTDDLEERSVRGLTVFAPRRDPTNADAVWLQLPGGRLHWEQLRDACLARAGHGRTVLFVGACYSGGLFHNWLPDAEAPGGAAEFPKVVALTSADPYCQAGTWSWHELLRVLRSRVAAPWSLGAVLRHLRGLDPTVTWVHEEARGEKADAALVSAWGCPRMAATVSLSEMLGQLPDIPQHVRQRSVTQLRLLPHLAEDQQVLALAEVTEPNGRAAFVASIVEHGFAILDIGEELYGENVAPMLRDAKAFLSAADEEAKMQVFDRTLDRSDENTNCGWAVAPGTWEMYKFVYSGGCLAKDDYPWPSSPSSFRRSVVRYYEFMQGLARQLCEVLAGSAGPARGGDWGRWAALLDPQPTPEDYYSNGDCRLFRYYGASEMSSQLFQGEVHADLGVLAVGPLSDVDGIHFLDRRDLVWRAPERDPRVQGRPVIAVWPGDVMRCLTGGWIAGAVHRVKLSPGSTDRYSMPFFIRARRGQAISCLVPGRENEEQYADYAEYEERRFRYSQAAGDCFHYVPPF